ncbi:MAG: sugar phosphate isomerase/epimerase [Bacteroidetes bacterium]|nr:sugar phosphate isomerase/epimerase [Bacteroidota bacterium]
MKKSTFSRRKFLGTTVAAAAGVTVVPFNYSFTNRTKKPNSKVNGVQLGLTTYSYRSIPHGLEEVLEYVLKAGVNALEMRSVLEEGLGIPAAPRRSRRGAELTDKEKAERVAASEAAREEQRKWRLALPMQKYADVRKMYNNAGVDLHIAKFAPANWSDEEIDYAYKATKVLGAYGITNEAGEEACKRLGKFAEKHNSLAIYHTHGQFGEHGFDLDTLLGYSPANRLNLDVGHYYGATGKHPNDIITKYHDQIPMIHVKDKTGPNHETPNANKPFGQGETPIADVLLLLKEEKWPIDVFVELEYKIESDSDPVKEVIKCIEYMRNILE